MGANQTYLKNLDMPKKKEKKGRLLKITRILIHWEGCIWGGGHYVRKTSYYNINGGGARLLVLYMYIKKMFGVKKVDARHVHAISIMNPLSYI